MDAGFVLPVVPSPIVFDYGKSILGAGVDRTLFNTAAAAALFGGARIWGDDPDTGTVSITTESKPATCCGVRKEDAVARRPSAFFFYRRDQSLFSSGLFRRGTSVGIVEGFDV